jgi:GTPase SAR1 family protein
LLQFSQLFQTYLIQDKTMPSESNEFDKYRVLVFGTTGVGKTSLCNELANPEEPQAVSDSAKGVTFKTYEFPPFDLAGKSCILTDTVGLNESSGGTLDPGDALRELVTLLLNSKKGYSLLIHVMQKGRILQIHKDNYNLFVEALTGAAIPVILVVTNCEEETPMSVWADENLQEFEQRGLKYQKIVCTSFARSKTNPRLEEIYADMRLESKASVISAIEECAAKSPIKIYETDKDWERLLKSVWNEFLNWFGKTFSWLNVDRFKATVDETLQALLIRLGFSREDAERFASNLNLLKKTDSTD